MDVQTYLNSGIIEDYCLGLLGPEARKEVARHALKYVEIQDVITSYEYALKRFVEDTGAPFEPTPAKKEILLKILKRNTL
jgi:hypothetical protein